MAKKTEDEKVVVEKKKTTKKKEETVEPEKKKTVKNKAEVKETTEEVAPKGKQVVRERIEKGPNGETIRIRETIIEDDDDSESSSDKLVNILTNKKFIIGIVAVLVVLLLLVVVLMAIKPKPVAEYLDVVAEKGDIYTSISGGQTTLASSSTAVIKSQVTATVTEVKYKNGAQVKEGDTLLVLDSSFASQEVKNLENAISSMEEMLELYKRKKQELEVKANCDGYVTNVQVQKDSTVNPGQILAYYIPTTTFRVEYTVPYDKLKTVTQWQTVNIKGVGTEGITGLIYDIESSTIDQGYITIGVYVNDSPINLSGVTSSAEVVTATGILNSTGTGTFWSTASLPIYATQQGVIETTDVQNGKKYQANSVIFKIKNDDITSRVTKYENDLIDLRNTVNYKRNEVNNFVVRATSSGIVTSEPLNVGESVYPSKELVELKTTGLIEAEFKVSAEDIQKINTGSDKAKKVRFTITGGEEEQYVNGIVSYADKYESTDIEMEYTVTVKINEDEATEDIIGKTAKIEVILEEATNVIYVPISALITERNKNFVYVWNGSEYEKREVIIGLETPEYVAITTGVNEGEYVRARNPEYKAQ
ncbi:MAG: HlyD family efflux transporter periplasmic adaptor subunit [Clostridiales bacterium]|nr:HlyD family efflux transporter periplasmic adaptor subunit [Clostridiales bacterium]